MDSFSLQFGDHVEYVEQELAPDGPGGKFKRSSTFTVACCRNSEVDIQAVVKEISDRNTERFGHGNWMWKTQAPKRKGTTQDSGSCADKTAAAIRIFRGELVSLEVRIDELCGEPAVVDYTCATRRANEFQEVYDLAKKQLPETQRANSINEELRIRAVCKKALLMAHAAKMSAIILKGLETLDNGLLLHPMLFRQLIEKRTGRNDDLSVIFDDASNKAARLMSNMSGWLKIQARTARKIKREEDMEETPQYDDEGLREEKIPNLYHLIINGLIPFVGGQALVLYAAIKNKCSLSYNTSKDIAAKDIPELADLIIGFIKKYSFSSLKDEIQVEDPISLVSWGMNKSESEVCDTLKLFNRQRMNLHRHEELDKLEAAWNSRSDREKGYHQVEVERLAAHAVTVTLGYLRENYPLGFEYQRPDFIEADSVINTNTSRTNPSPPSSSPVATPALSPLTTELAAKSPMNVLADVAVLTADELTYCYHPSLDSGYDTDSGNADGSHDRPDLEPTFASGIPVHRLQEGVPCNAVSQLVCPATPEVTQNCTTHELHHTDNSQRQPKRQKTRPTSVEQTQNSVGEDSLSLYQLESSVMDGALGDVAGLSVEESRWVAEIYEQELNEQFVTCEQW